MPEPTSGYLRCTAARTLAFSEDVPFPETLLNAFRAWLLSSIGYRRPGRAKSLSGIELRDLARRVKLLLLDVDGVLTDGRIVYDSSGRDSKFFDVHDGLGVYVLHKSGIKTVLITAKGSKTLAPRAKDMRVAEVFADIFPKCAVLEKILKKYSVNIDEVCFVGDDLVDLSIMRKVGLPVAVANAAIEIKEVAAFVTSRSGGRGAVREVAELILKSQDKWKDILKFYAV